MKECEREKYVERERDGDRVRGRGREDARDLILCPFLQTLHRKLLDTDVEEHEAYADPRLRPYYREFHRAALSATQRIIRVQRRAPLVVNIRCHQDSESGLPVMIGTLNGQTLHGVNTRLRSRIDGDVRWRDKVML